MGTEKGAITLEDRQEEQLWRADKTRPGRGDMTLKGGPPLVGGTRKKVKEKKVTTQR